MKKKGKFVPVYTRRARGGRTVVVPFTEQSNSSPGRSEPREKLSGTNNQSGRYGEEKILFSLPGFEPRTFQPTA